MLDSFADRIGDNTWQTNITEEGLAAVKKQLGVVPLERLFGQENQEVEPKEGRKRRPFYSVIESPKT